MMQDALTFGHRPPAVSRDEGIALIVALAAHAALVAVLAFGAPGREPVPPPARMTVTISDEVADVSTSPVLQSDPMAGGAPELGEVPPPPPEELLPPPPQAQRQTSGPRPQPSRTPPPPQPPNQPQKNKDKGKKGGANFGDTFGNQDFAGRDPKPPAGERISDQMKSAARQSIGSEVLPFWNRCPVDGADIEKLRVEVVMHLDRSGRLLSMDAPNVTGRTAANAAQVPRFIECAQTAIRSASPFNLPADSYDFWKNYPVRLGKKRNN
jgi:hypothetical protein